MPLYLSECLRLSVKLSSINFTFFLIYRPPNTNILPFFNDFTDIIHSINNTNFLIAGDFNFHFGNPFPPHSSFSDLLDSLSLVQNVNFPTHISGNTLDLIITLFLIMFYFLNLLFILSLLIITLLNSHLLHLHYLLPNPKFTIVNYLTLIIIIFSLIYLYICHLSHLALILLTTSLL